MARLFGDRGQPQYDDTDGADFAGWLTEVSNYAAKISDRSVADLAERDAIFYRWPGMNVWVLSNTTMYQWTGAAYVPTFAPRRPFTPTWTSPAPALGTGATASAYYSISDGYCDFTAVFVLGTGTISISDPRLNLPVAPDLTAVYNLPVATWVAEDITAGASGRFSGLATLINTGDIRFYLQVVQGSIATQLSPLTSLAPFVWANGDVLTVFGRYPVAGA